MRLRLQLTLPAAGGRRESELRRAKDEEPEEDAADSAGGQDVEEDGAEENDGSESGGVDGVEVDRDEKSEKYPVVQNELDNYHNRVRGCASAFGLRAHKGVHNSGEKDADGAEVFQFQPPSLCASLCLNVTNSVSDARRKLKKKAGFAEKLKKYQRGDANSVKVIGQYFSDHIADKEKKTFSKLRTRSCRQSFGRQRRCASSVEL